MNTREDIVTRIKANLPFGADPGCAITEETALAELGVNSLHLITMLLTLQDEYTLDVDEVMEEGRMPLTVGELVTLVEKGANEGIP